MLPSYDSHLHEYLLVGQRIVEKQCASASQSQRRRALNTVCSPIGMPRPPSWLFAPRAPASFLPVDSIDLLVRCNGRRARRSSMW